MVRQKVDWGLYSSASRVVREALRPMSEQYRSPLFLPFRDRLDVATERSYTNGMKTAVSLPDEVFREADKLARRTGVSRSRLVSDALREYVARHAPDEITEAMNTVVDALSTTEDAFAAASARRLLKQSEW
jgi:Arc/MetJ-type ribon-helix-helix transcriptional regulator